MSHLENSAGDIRRHVSSNLFTFVETHSWITTPLHVNKISVLKASEKTNITFKNQKSTNYFPDHLLMQIKTQIRATFS